MPRSKAELEKLLELATKLGFKDDVLHWTQELEKLKNG